MPITTTIKLRLPDAQLPAGVSNDTLTEADYTGREDFVHVLTPASTYDNDTVATAIAAIESAITTWVEGTLAVDLSLDLDNVTGEIVIESILRHEGETVARQYRADYDDFTVRGYFVWYNSTP